MLIMANVHHFTLPNMYFPEWWDVHTHRCNHRGCLPIHQVPYGQGRALIGDWGRVGGACVQKSEKGVQVIPQMTVDLVNKLYHTGPPSLLFSANQFDSGATKTECCAEDDVDLDMSGFPLDLLTTFHFGFRQLLTDPVMSEQASAAYLYGKVMGLIRRNAGIVKEKKPQSAVIIDFLEELKQIASAGTDAHNCDALMHVLERIHENLNTVQQGEDLIPMKKRGRGKSVSSNPVPVSLRNILDFIGSHESRLLSATDPLLLRLATRETNPAYHGHGLLRRAGDNLIFGIPRSPSQLFMCASNRDSKSNIFPLPLPPIFSSKTRLYEVDVSSPDYANAFTVVTRWKEEQTGNVAYMRVTSDEEAFNVNSCAVPCLPDSASSISVSPWLRSDWALTGSTSRSDGTSVAFSHLYTGDELRPIWSGHILLDDQHDGIRGHHTDLLRAAGRSSETDPVETDLDTYIKHLSPTIALDHPSLREFGLRVAFGSHPCQLLLSTRKRILSSDTRQNQSCRELFSLSHSFSTPLGLSPMFNPTEYITYSPTRLIGDIYGIVATQYSMIYFDKRMPGRCVCHWSHNLQGAPTYMDWTMLDKRIQDQFDLPQVLLSAASQFPADVSLFGTNFTGPAAPQLIGPSMTGNRPISIVDDISVQFCHSQPVLSRLQATLCGMLCQLEQDDHISVLALSSHGDVFRHSWAFTEAKATELSDSGKRCNASWLNEMMCQSTTDDDDNAGVSDETGEIIDVTEAMRLDPPSTSDEEALGMWDFDGQLCTAEAIAQETHNYSEHLLADLKAMWSGDSNFPTQLTSERLLEESKRTAELDSLTVAAKQRLKRLKSIADKLSRELK